MSKPKIEPKDFPTSYVKWKKPHTKILFQELENVLNKHFSEHEFENDSAEVFLNCLSWKEKSDIDILENKKERTVSFNLKIEVKTIS